MPVRAGIKRSIEAVPSVHTVARQYARMPIKKSTNLKAIGEDRVGNEILRTNATAVAAAMIPLYLKSALWIYTPLQWRGGHLMDLYKGKGDRLACSAYRDVTIGHAAGKPMSRSLRQSLAPALERMALETQTG